MDRLDIDVTYGETQVMMDVTDSRRNLPRRSTDHHL